MTDKKILVAYFSATGITKNIAKKLANVTNADLFEIKPKQLYTNDDLDWTNKQSRSSIEMANKESRPEIALKIDDIKKYDIIFIGFPIWWYREPSIIDTFMESYDFSNKIIVPFATSGGSNIGDSGKFIQSLAPSAKVLKGRCFSLNVLNEELELWINDIIK